MRVVAGIAGGRRLKAPPGRRLRPTSERVREALFSSLTSLDVLKGARVVDLFAGTGALGIEALSRGASSAVFVEADPTAVAVIRANLDGTGVAGGTVVHADVARFLGDVSDAGHRFDVAFADPPYAFEGWPAVLEKLPADLVALEARTHIDVGPRWKVLRSRRYGDTVVTIARLVPGQAAQPKGEA